MMGMNRLLKKIDFLDYLIMLRIHKPSIKMIDDLSIGAPTNIITCKFDMRIQTQNDNQKIIQQNLWRLFSWNYQLFLLSFHLLNQNFFCATFGIKGGKVCSSAYVKSIFNGSMPLKNAKAANSWVSLPSSIDDHWIFI